MATDGPILGYIRKGLAKGHLHMTLLDPDEQGPREAAAMAKAAVDAGTDAIMLGGSTGVDMDKMDTTCMAIKRVAKLPIILFPTSSGTISKFADAIYFMSMLNSKDPRYISREQANAAPVIKTWGLETISMGYIIVEPGMKVGEVGKAEVVPREREDIAVGYALAAEMFGMSLVYLEAGSGADKPVPAMMVSMVKKAIGVPLIVGGGIRTPDAARNAVRAGADIIVTGTVVEGTKDLGERLSAIIKAVKGG